MPLSGRVAVVTGAARGLGAAIARELDRRGAKVALLGLEPQELAHVAASLRHEATWCQADVTD
ncbi:SDR family NAD(P)-dependent oxidoreductase, partial [Streptomyces sp. SID7760]|nr:SDR family NAD(P)-dependent oxidoreductase [Streptomyces sp. SID7760]